MLAAATSQEPPATSAPPARAGSRGSHPAFHAAYRELCTRLWLELEQVAQSLGPTSHAPDAEQSAAILRLELIVLVDASRSARWRSTLLAAEQCDRLCSMLTDLLAALYVDAQDLPAGLADAQDRLLDELIGEARPASSAPVPICRCQRGRERSAPPPPPADYAHELVA